MSDIMKDLRSLYPDQIIRGLRQQDSNLYFRCMNRARRKNIPLKKYFNNLGFRYIKHIQITDEDMEKKLLEFYPDKVITLLSVNHKDLYKTIAYIAERNSISIEQYLCKLGFTYSKRTRQKC